MKAKEKFELLSGKTGDVYNVLPVKKNTLKAFEVSKEDYVYLQTVFMAYSRGRTENKKLLEHVKSVKITKLETYPLPGYVSKDGEGYINLSVLPSKFTSDYSSPDLYAMLLYSLALKTFINKNPFPDDVENIISEFYIQTYMNLFGKKYGLTGTYKSLIHSMQVILGLYVRCSILGKELNDESISKISNKYYLDANSLKIDDSIKTTVGMLRLMRSNNILPITENIFGTNVINVGGMNSLPMFEDGYRLFATIIASSVPGNTVFTKYWRKKQQKIYEKVLTYASDNLIRSLD